MMRRTSILVNPVAPLLAIGLVWPGAGCSAPPVGADPSSPLSSARHRAVRELAAQHDDEASLRLLIEQLDHDDPAVRWHAAAILQTRTGQTLGYRYDDPPDARRAAVGRWVTWHKSLHGRDESPANPDRKPADG